MSLGKLKGGALGMTQDASGNAEQHTNIRTELKKSSGCISE